MHEELKPTALHSGEMIVTPEIADKIAIPERPFYRPDPIARFERSSSGSLWNSVIEPILAFIGILTIAALIFTALAKL